MGPTALIDDLLELTVAGSFSNIGYRARRAMYGWASAPAGALEGRTVLITGPTSGLGRQAADEVAALGARVILVGRSEARLEIVRQELEARHGAGRFPIVVADMSSIPSVRSAAAAIDASEPTLDIVIDNAGAMFPARRVTNDGIEATLAVLVVGPFVLLTGLLPVLHRTGGARVIAVSSGGQYTQPLDLDDLQSTAEPFSGPRAYARAKRAQVQLIREWSRRLGRTGIGFHAMHPGWTATPGLAEALPRFARVMAPLLRTPAEGTDTIVWLSTSDDGDRTGGGLWLDRRQRPFDRVPWTRVTVEERRRLWELVVGLSGSVDPAPGS